MTSPSSELLQYMAIIAKVSTMADGGNSVLLHTNELTPEQSTTLFLLKGKPNWTVHKPNEITVEDIPEIEADMTDVNKTPGQRLRAVLYVLWEQSNKTTYPEFEVFYRAKMEKIINGLKEKIT